MEHSPIRILGIAPYEGMQTAMERMAESYPNIQMDVYTGDLEDGVAIVKQASGEPYDAIISRGGTAQLIEQITDIPVVSIQLSVYDVLRAIKMAENYSNLYAIVGFPSITEPAHTLCDLLRLDMDIITVHSAEEVSTTLDRLKLGGYKMVVSDVVTHTLAHQKGFDAFLITSGTESLRSAFDQAISLSERFHQLRQENLFLKSIAHEKNSNTIVLSLDGKLCYSSQEAPTAEQLVLLQTHIPEIPLNGPLRFYKNEQGALYRVTARVLRIGSDRYFSFHYQISQIPLRSSKSGIRFSNEAEAMQLFTTSFYGISGAMGTLDSQINAIALTRQPVMISGELGTGKEQIARALYLRSPRIKNPFVSIDCTLLNEKTWDFLLNHYNSPLNDDGNTVYFQNLEAVPEKYQQELLAAILETNLTKRVRLIFSCTCSEGQSLPETAQTLSARLGCLPLPLPPLRSRADEIPSLASLYLSNLNMELGKQIIGFEPRAIEQMLHYEWPNNYTQFKQVLQELTTLADSSYIRASAVTELLARERASHKATAPRVAASVFELRTLDDITRDAVQKTVEALGGNQTAAAKQLGIGRTTLWRYLNSPPPVSLPHGKES